MSVHFTPNISIALGRHIGIGSGLVAVFSYTAIQLALYGLFGFFCESLINPIIGLSLHWSFYAFSALLVIQFLGLYKIDLNIRILGTLMVLETSILLILSIAILLHADTLSFQPLSFHTMFNDKLGVSIMFALASFIGFEATTIYSEESINPKTGVSIATYTSVTIIMIFSAFVTLLIVNAYGVNNVTSAASMDPANFWFKQSTKHLGEYATSTMRFLLLSSIFASLLAFHHTLARYFYAMSREGVLPKVFSKTHQVFHSPHNASYLQTITAGLGIILFVMTKADPYAIMFTWMSALGTIGIIGLQLLVSLAIIVYFYRAKVDTRLWHTKIAPILAGQTHECSKNAI